MKEIELTQGRVALIDDEDYDIVSLYNWHTRRTTRSDYAATTRCGKTLHMHRMVMLAPAGLEVDHINGDGLDNRKSNLRVCTVKENRRNRRPSRGQRRSSSGLKGVQKNGKKWASYITVDYQKHYLGIFTTKEMAARAYNSAAKKHFGEFARLNEVPA